MKLAIVLSALAISTVMLPFSAGAIAQPVSSQMYASRLADITSGPGEGFFNAHPWEIKVSRDDNGYVYSGKNIVTNTGITLAGGKLRMADGKHFYRWNNSGTVYLVTWQPGDPNYARVQVLGKNGREILNKLMWTPTGD
jgi:hypothetical protein